MVLQFHRNQPWGIIQGTEQEHSQNQARLMSIEVLCKISYLQLNGLAVDMVSHSFNKTFSGSLNCGSKFRQ